MPSGFNLNSMRQDLSEWSVHFIHNYNPDSEPTDQMIDSSDSTVTTDSHTIKTRSATPDSIRGESVMATTLPTWMHYRCC